MSESKKKSGYSHKREQPQHAQPKPGRVQKALKASLNGNVVHADGSLQSESSKHTRYDGGSGKTKIKTKAR
jgi:hypothetical protein